MNQATQDDLAGFKAAIAHGDWVAAKSLGLKILSNQDPDTAPKSVALAALLNPGSAFDQLASNAKRSTAEDIAYRLLQANELAPVSKPELVHLAYELRQEITKSGVPLQPDLCSKILNVLRDARAFDALVPLADRMVAIGARAPETYKLLAQGLIDTGHPTAALASLTTLLQNTATTHPEHIDALAIAGRIHKQVYVDARGTGGSKDRSQELQEVFIQSARYYEEAYLAALTNPHGKASEWSYPAVNLIAVLMRAKRDQIKIATRIHPAALAKDIIKALDVQGVSMNPWDEAMIGEAYVAVGNYVQAGHWLQRYASNTKTNAFALAGTIRQLEEVWQFSAHDAAAGQLLLFLKAQLLAKDSSVLELTANDRLDLVAAELQSADEARPELYMTKGRPKQLSWFKAGLDRANSVGLIKRKSDGQGFGTGFLVKGNDFFQGLGDAPILLTNAHVISSLQAELNDPLQPSEHLDRAEVEFTNVGSSVDMRTYQFERILFESPRSQYDTCLIQLKKPPNNIKPCELSTTTPDVGNTRVIIIGHPGGERDTKVSLHEGGITSFGPKGLLAPGNDGGLQFLRYTNPTIGGNSGSPVFDIDDWRVVGVHHAGPAAQNVNSGGSAAQGQPSGNEGVFIHSIAVAARKAGPTKVVTGESFSASTAPVNTFHGPTVEHGGVQATETEQCPFATSEFAPIFPSAAIVGHRFAVELTVPRSTIEKIIASHRPQKTAPDGVIPVASAHIDLTSPDGLALVQSVANHRQWLDRKSGENADDAKCQWIVTPLKPGTTTLLLQFSARQFVYGETIAIGPIVQHLPMTFRPSPRRQALTLAKWLFAMALGAFGMLVAIIMPR